MIKKAVSVRRQCRLPVVRSWRPAARHREASRDSEETISGVDVAYWSIPQNGPHVSKQS